MKIFNEDFFKKHKLTAKDLKAKLSKVSTLSSTETDQKVASGISRFAASYEPSVQSVVDRIFSRARDGVNRSISDGRIFLAIDKAYDVAFSQISPTLMEGLMDNNQATSEKVARAMNDWGMGNLITTAECSCGGPCTKGCGEKKVLNLPVFFRVFVPLVKSYVNIRWAKIYTDRNTFPLFKYEPLKNNAINRLRTEIITDRVQMMATQFGYNTNLRQEILQALLYSFSFTFPKEHWYSEEFGGEVIREGLRYNTPHPSRTFVDTSDRPSTFNTDSGCSFGGYWKVEPWRNIRDNPDYWNKDKVSYGENLILSHPTFFEEIYPCALKFPTCQTTQDNMMPGVSDHQREDRHGNFYVQTDDDKATTTIQYFEKLNPKQVGLGDYDGDVWFRFVLAGCDTIIYAEPMSYRPITYTGYDADENRARNASLALETMPFQDHIGNMLSQYLLSVKQNLMKVVFYDQDMVDGNQIQKIQNMGEKMFRQIHFVGFSGREHAFSQTNPERSFTNINFPVQNTQEIAGCINTMLNILERLLSMSAQELGQPATHEQTAEEITTISSNVGTRLALTASFVDDAIHARKVQLYEAIMANGSEDIYANIEYGHQLNDELLKAIGFSVVPNGIDEGVDVEAVLKQAGYTYKVKGPKTGLVLEGFASSRDGENRINGPQLASAMAQFLQAWANPNLVATIGPEQTIKIFNQVASIAGFPKDFRLKETAQPQAGQVTDQIGQLQQQVAQAIQESGQAIMKEVADVVGPMSQAQEAAQQNDQQQNRAIAEILQRLDQLAQTAAPINYDQSQVSPVV